MSRRQRQATDEQLFPSLRGQGLIAVDCETHDPLLKTNGPGWHRDDTYIAGVAIGTEAGFRQYYPIQHAGGGNMDYDKVIRYLDSELCHADEPKTGAHLLYDHGFLEQTGIRLRGPLWDIQNAEPLLDENKFTYSLESLSKQYLGIGKIDDELDEWIKANVNEPDAKRNPKRYIARAPGDIVAPYAIGDVNHPLEIFKRQKPELERQGLWDIFQIESRLIPMLYRMRARGVAVDLDRAEQMHRRMRQEQQIARNEMRRMVGFDVEVWAAKSLERAFNELSLSFPRTPKTDKPSFTKPFMERMEHPFVKLVLEDRRLDKMCGTFLEGCILEGHYNGRVYCQFNQQKSDDGGAVSGRFSSSNPNLQFIPVRTDEGKLLRSMFIPDRGQSWWKVDYSQIEFRLMVHDATCLGLRGATEIAQRFHDDPDTDFHEVVAQIVFGENFTKEQRSRGKTINFGLAFGEGEKKLASQLGVSLEQGQAVIAEYHRKVPFMSKLADEFVRRASSDGEVSTLWGRIRRFPWGRTKWNDDGSNSVTILPHRVPGAKRVFTHKALNARIQGSAADVMKKAMVDLDDSGVFNQLGMPMLTVHDELDGSCPPDRQSLEALRELKNVMENTVSLKVPLRVDVDTGENWGTVSNQEISGWTSRERPETQKSRSIRT